MSALRELSPYLAVFAAAAAVALFCLLFMLMRKLGRLREAQHVVLGPHGRRDLVTHAGMLEEQVRNLRDAVEMLSAEVEQYRGDLDEAFSNIALVRFDAFRDTGGEQSAAIAVLDNYRSGVVISVIAGRDVARLYVKHLEFGRADRELSPEENEAVKRAVPLPLAPGQLSGKPVPTLPRVLRIWERQEEEGSATVLEGQERLDLESMALESDHRPWAAEAARRAPAAVVTVEELAMAGEDADEEIPPSSPSSLDKETEPAADGKAEAPAEAAEDRPTETTRRRQPEDWLGGEELDF